MATKDHYSVSGERPNERARCKYCARSFALRDRTGRVNYLGMNRHTVDHAREAHNRAVMRTTAAEAREAALREALTTTKRLAREATNGWACYAKRKIEHDDISRIHRALDHIEAPLTRSQP